MAEEREIPFEQWAKSDVKESNLLEMVRDGLLPAKEIIGWRPAYGEDFPTPDTSEIVDNKRFSSNPPAPAHEETSSKKPHTTGGPKVNPAGRNKQTVEENVPKQKLKKRKLVCSDSEDEQTESLTSAKPAPAKSPASRPAPKIRRSTRKPQDIDLGSKGDVPPVTMPSEPRPKPRVYSQSGKTINTTEVQPPTNNQSEQDTSGLEVDPQAGNQAGENNVPTGVPEPPAESAGKDPKDSDQGPTLTETSMTNDPVGEPEKTPKQSSKIISGPLIDDNEEEIPRIKEVEDSFPPSKLQWRDRDGTLQGIIINRQGEDEELELLKKNLTESTRLMNRIHLRNEAKTSALEKLVPHLENLERVQAELAKTREDAQVKERKLKDQINQLMDASFNYRGTIGAQSTKIESLAARVKKLEEINAQLAAGKLEAKDALEEHKVRTRARFEIFADKVKKAESVRDDIANATAPVLNAIFQNGLGTSQEDAVQIFEGLRTTPTKYFNNIKDVVTMGASQALAIMKSLYPRVEIDADGDGFADGTTDEQAMELINQAQDSAEKLAADVLENFQL